MIREISGEALPALIGPGPNRSAPNNYMPHATEKFTTYTLGLVWDELTPSVIARVLRDCFQLARICRVNRTDFKVACSSTQFDKYLSFLEISRTTKMEEATYWRAYYVKHIPEIPEHAEMQDIIQVDPGRGTPQRLRLDPNFPKKVEYVDVQRISESVPLYRSPPSGPADWNQQDMFGM